MNILLSAGVCALFVATAGCAFDDPASKSEAQTDAWLQLQPSGKFASAVPQAAAPIERDLSAQRWLDSYKYPIPEYYEQKKGGSVTGGSGGSN